MTDDVQSQYDLASMTSAERGKFYERYRKGTNVVLLGPDGTEAFSTEDAMKADR